MTGKDGEIGEISEIKKGEGVWKERCGVGWRFCEQKLWCFWVVRDAVDPALYSTRSNTYIAMVNLHFFVVMVYS